MRGYKTSRDYKRLKELLDKGQVVIFLWVHNTSHITFPDIAKKVKSVSGGVNGDWYSLGGWSYFPTINEESFEQKCKYIGLEFIEPEED